MLANRRGAVALERPAEVMAYIVMAYAVMAITSVGQQARCCGSRTRPAEEVMAYIVSGYGHNECWPTGGVLWLSNDRLKKNLTFKELFAYLSRCYMLIFIPYDKSQSFMYEVYSHGLVMAYVVMAYTGLAYILMVYIVITRGGSHVRGLPQRHADFYFSFFRFCPFKKMKILGFTVVAQLWPI